MEAKHLAGFSRGSSILGGVLFVALLGSSAIVGSTNPFTPNLNQMAASLLAMEDGPATNADQRVIDSFGTGKAVCNGLLTDVKYACKQIGKREDIKLFEQSCRPGFKYTITISKDNVSVVPETLQPDLLGSCQLPVPAPQCKTSGQAIPSVSFFPGRIVGCVNVSVDGLKRGCSRELFCGAGQSLDQAFTDAKEGALEDLVDKLTPRQLEQAAAQIGSFSGGDELNKAFLTLAQEETERQIRENGGKLAGIERLIDQCAETGSCNERDVISYNDQKANLENDTAALREQTSRLAAGATSLSADTPPRNTSNATPNTTQANRPLPGNDSTFGGNSAENTPMAQQPPTQEVTSSEDDRMARIRSAAQSAIETQRENIQSGNLSKAASYRGTSATDLCKYVYGPGGDCGRASSSGRQELARTLGIDNYSGTASQNAEMVARAKNQERYGITTHVASNQTEPLLDLRGDTEQSNPPTNLADNPPIPRPNPLRTPPQGETATQANNIPSNSSQTSSAPLSTDELNRFPPDIREAVEKQCELGRCSLMRRIAEQNTSEEERARNVTQAALLGAESCSRVSIADCFKAANLPSTREGRRSVCESLGLSYCDQVGQAQANIRMADDVKRFSQTGSAVDVTQTRTLTIDARGAILGEETTENREEGEQIIAPSYAQGGTLRDLEAFYDRAQDTRGDTQTVYRVTGDVCGVVGIGSGDASCSYYRRLVDAQGGVLARDQLPYYTRQEVGGALATRDAQESPTAFTENQSSDTERFSGIPQESIQSGSLSAPAPYTVKQSDYAQLDSLYGPRLNEIQNNFGIYNPETGSQDAQQFRDNAAYVLATQGRVEADRYIGEMQTQLDGYLDQRVDISNSNIDQINQTQAARLAEADRVDSTRVVPSASPAHVQTASQQPVPHASLSEQSTGSLIWNNLTGDQTERIDTGNELTRRWNSYWFDDTQAPTQTSTQTASEEAPLLGTLQTTNGSGFNSPITSAGSVPTYSGFFSCFYPTDCGLVNTTPTETRVTFTPSSDGAHTEYSYSGAISPRSGAVSQNLLAQGTQQVSVYRADDGNIRAIVHNTSGGAVYIVENPSNAITYADILSAIASQTGQ